MEYQLKCQSSLEPRFNDRVEDGQALTCPCTLVVDHAHQTGRHVEFFDGRDQTEPAIFGLTVDPDFRSHRHGLEHDLLLDAEVISRLAKAIAGAMGLELAGGHPPNGGFCQ